MFSLTRDSADMRLYLSLMLLFIVRYPGHNCGIPEASQEGVLHSFKSYADVAMFHYTMPAEVLRATWQFAAFMDDKRCPPRIVHICLQWGSYPVVTVDNSSLLLNMHLQEKHTITLSAVTSLEPSTSTVLPVYSPEPGDWFVAAYLSHWDEKVQQQFLASILDILDCVLHKKGGICYVMVWFVRHCLKSVFQGLGHKCHYSIGSVAMWNQVNSIEYIPVGCRKRVRTVETTTYYKIFVPVGTWSLRVRLWGCNFTVHPSRANINDYCIKGLALEGRVLPSFNYTHPPVVGNLTTHDSYTFIESSPYENSYYYLMVVSDSIIEFSIQVDATECPVVLTERPYREFANGSVTSRTRSRFAVEDVVRRIPELPDSNATLRRGTFNYDKKQYRLSRDDFNNDRCMPRFELTRIKHSQAFSTVYLLRGREWPTSWLALTDLCPIITQFVIHPFVDIGGTLDISVHLELDKLQTNQLVVVRVCVRRGRAPKRVDGRFVCDNDNMSMNLSSFGKHDASLLIPYPQPDTWHVGLDAKCLLHGQPTSCEMEEILISLNVQTRQCVFPDKDPCGPHGLCEEIHKGTLYYTACSCVEGYTGWGCTIATSPDVETYRVLTGLILILSNGFFIPAICLAIERKLYTEGLVYTATMLFSSLYHACDQRDVAYCTAKYEVLQWCDFFASILAFWVTLIAIARLPRRFESFCHMVGVFVISYGVELDRTSLASIVIPLTIGIAIPVVSCALKCARSKARRKPARMSKLLVGLLLAGSGSLLFSFVETEANYKYVHSAWHMTIAGSLIFLLPPARTQKPEGAERNSTTGRESFNCSNCSESPVFTVASGEERLMATG